MTPRFIGEPARPERGDTYEDLETGRVYSYDGQRWRDLTPAYRAGRVLGVVLVAATVVFFAWLFIVLFLAAFGG